MWAKHEIKRGQLIYKEADKKKSRCHAYFGGPEVKPGSSNMSSLEREEDFAPMGDSCSITCISDITEWDTALQQETHTQ